MERRPDPYPPMVEHEPVTLAPTDAIPGARMALVALRTELVGENTIEYSCHIFVVEYDPRRADPVSIHHYLREVLEAFVLLTPEGQTVAYENGAYGYFDWDHAMGYIPASFWQGFGIYRVRYWDKAVLFNEYDSFAPEYEPPPEDVEAGAEVNAETEGKQGEAQLEADLGEWDVWKIDVSRVQRA